MSNKQRKVKISSVGSSLKPFSPRVIERERKKKKLAYPVRHAFEDTLQNKLSEKQVVFLPLFHFEEMVLNTLRLGKRRNLLIIGTQTCIVFQLDCLSHHSQYLYPKSNY